MALLPLQSNVADLQRFTKNHAKLQCFDLGFALDTFRMVSERVNPSVMDPQLLCVDGALTWDLR